MKKIVFAVILKALLMVNAIAAEDVFEKEPADNTKKNQKIEQQRKHHETIVITAERFPVEERKTPRLVTVVYSERLKEIGANNLADALRRIGGLSYQAYAPLGTNQGGMNSSVSIRGIKNGELVLLNGAPVQGAAAHGYDINTIPIDQIERVEIMKGAGSIMYGADAMSGVINIITKRPQDETVFKGSAEFGSESFHNHSLSAFSSGVNIGVNYQHLGKQIGISRSFSSQYHYNQNETDKVAWILNTEIMEDLYLDYLGSYYQTGFEKHYDDGQKPYEKIDQDHQKNFAALKYKARDFMVEVFGAYDEMRRRETTSPEDSEDRNQNYNLGLKGDYRIDVSDWHINLGADWIYWAAKYNNIYGEHHRNDYAPFVQVKKTFLDDLVLTLGARYQFIVGEPGTDDHQRLLPSAGLLYEATDALSFFANAGKAFRTPTFNNLYYESSFLIGNPGLEPEEGWTFEIGMKYDNELIHLRLAGFSMLYKEKIEIDRSQGYPLTYINAGHYESNGIEWEVGFFPFARRPKSAWLRNVSVTTSGYWADPMAEDIEGKKYQTGPKLQSTIGIGYLSDVLTLNFNAQILNIRERNLDGYVVINGYGKLKLFKGMGYLVFSLDNILDERVLISGDMTKDASNQYAYYEIGRLFKVGYEVAF